MGPPRSWSAICASAGLPVVDVSADFRLHDLATYEGTYGEHGAPQLLVDAVYGLPELHRDRIAGAQLVANPGCYPTAALLALAPLAQAGLIEDVVISAASGVSGAGRGRGERLHFVSVDENFGPYGVNGHRHAPEIVQELAGMGSSAPLSFVPHLLPLDQGLLASCYVRLARDLGTEELRALYDERYAGEPFVELGDRAARRSRRAGHEPVPRPRALDDAGRALAFAAIDNLWKGAAGQAVQNLNLMLGLPETEGLAVTFFRSRWVEAPAGVEELDPAALAPQFRAAGVACGLKDGGSTDLGLLVCDAAEVGSALLLTRNAAAAAPVRVCREQCDRAGIRAAVVNSGTANAAVGERGYRDALAMRDAAAEALGLDARSVAIAETGPIGVPLAIDAVKRGVVEAAGALSERGGEDLARAIMTTDRGPKRCTVRSGGVTVSAQAKGAGMIQPGFATMLCFVQTDARVPEPEAALRAAVADSFERITVDGQMSTNDTVLLQATGSSGHGLPEGLLDAVLLQLALEVVADGEGATRVGRIEVSGAASSDEAERVARAIANSPLVKAAFYGRDPNWGRIAQAAGMALAGEELEELGPDAIEASEMGSEAVEAEIALRLERGNGSAHVCFSDLTHDYVELNSEYTT